MGGDDADQTREKRMSVFSDAKELATHYGLSEDGVIERLRDKSFMCMDSFGETQMSEQRQERLVDADQARDSEKQMSVFSDVREIATAHDLSEDERLREKSFRWSERRQERLVELMEENETLRAEIEKLQKFVDDIDAYALNLTDIGHMVTGDEIAWNIQRRIAQIDD